MSNQAEGKAVRRQLTEVLDSIREFNINDDAVSMGGKFKPTRKCPNCEAPVESEFLACPECGHDLE
jgi:hypothetical protein